MRLPKPQVLAETELLTLGWGVASFGEFTRVTRPKAR